jgi:4-hydroxy-tetrahydrodipicolinate reductase
MGHATAEAAVRAGCTLVPYSFTGQSEAVAVGNIGVCGVPVELVSPSERQTALEKIVAEYPDLIVVDYTLPTAVNGEICTGVVLALRVYGLLRTGCGKD